MTSKCVGHLRPLVRGHFQSARTYSHNVLVVNSGSSSIKCQVIDPVSKSVFFNCIAERLNTPRGQLVVAQPNSCLQDKTFKSLSYQTAFRLISELVCNSGACLTAAGHRVVHGGPHFRSAAVLVNKEVMARIDECSLFAPLHNPNALGGIRLMTESFPSIPHVAVFDTAFHQTMPERAYRYAIPERLFREAHIRKFGFHGISHGYVIDKAAKQFRHMCKSLKIVSAHLGNGCSVTAALNGRSVDTSMGLTPLEGLVMGQRSGDVDPAIFYVLKEKYGYGLERTLQILNSESGFSGLAGASDFRDVEEMLLRGVEAAAVAVEVFCYRLAKYVASYVVPLGGLDLLVFTGGIGEKSCLIRAMVLDLLRPLGFQVDEQRNKVNGNVSEGVITREWSRPSAMVVQANEELIIAEETLRFVQNMIPNDLKN